jgi:hypothetical protein
MVKRPDLSRKGGGFDAVGEFCSLLPSQHVDVIG